MTTLLPTELFPIDDDERLFISPIVTDWSLVHDRGIEVIIDLEGDLDQGVSTRPGHLLYIYHHIYDEDLPDLARMQALAMLGAHLIRNGQKVLAHCGMGFNRSALLAGLILTRAGRRRPDRGRASARAASGCALQRAVRRISGHVKGRSSSAG